MKNIIKLALLCLFLAGPAQAESKNRFSQPANVESVTVLASSSLTAAITEIARNYSREQKMDLNAVFDSSSELYAKIEDGDPADIVIVSDVYWLDKLEESGLLDADARIKIASNRLALVASNKFDISIESSQLEEMLDYIRNRALMVIADPSTVTLGERTVEVLKNINKWSRFEKFMVLAPTSAKTVDLIIKSETAGIVYSTDAKLYGSSLRYIGDIPSKLHNPVEYYAAVVLGNNMAEAQEFLAYLRSDNAKEVLKNAGFVVE